MAGKDKFTSSAIMTLIGAFCIELVVGSQYAWGSMAIYIVGYFRLIGNLEANMSQFYLVLPLIVITSTIFFPIGMQTAKRLGPRVGIATGGIIVITTTFLSSYAQTPGAFFAIYSIGFGIGKGFLYPAPLEAGWSHLEDKKGLVSGIIVSGLGIGSFIFGMLVSWLVNPSNLTPTMVEVVPGVHEAFFTSEVNKLVPQMLQMLCIAYSALICIGLLMISKFEPSEDEQREID